MKLTPTQWDVLVSIGSSADPWWGARYDGRKVAGRRKTLRTLIENELIEISYNWSSAWITKKGADLVRASGLKY